MQILQSQSGKPSEFTPSGRKNNFNNLFFSFPKRPEWGSTLGEMSEYDHPLTQDHVPEYWNPQFKSELLYMKM
jgi:hypothetical protein